MYTPFPTSAFLLGRVEDTGSEVTMAMTLHRPLRFLCAGCCYPNSSPSDDAGSLLKEAILMIVEDGRSSSLQC